MIIQPEQCRVKVAPYACGGKPASVPGGMIREMQYEDSDSFFSMRKTFWQESRDEALAEKADGSTAKQTRETNKVD